MNKNTLVIAVVVVAVLLGGLFLVSMNKKPSDSMTTTQPTATTGESMNKPEEGGEPSMDVKEVSVEMGGFYFKPNEIRVKKGEKVKINFTNAGGMHDFTIDELNVKTNKINTGEVTSVEFSPDKTGTFEFYCSVGNHRQMGMKGTIIVE